MSDAAIRVYALPAIWGAPSPSPFVIKLLTWLRMAGVEHELVTLTRPPRSATGKIPYIEWPDGRRLADSGAIIAALAEERGIDLDAHLGAAERAQALLLRRTIEEHLYFVGLYERFVTPAGFAATRRDYFRHMPWPVRALAPLVVRRRARKNLYGQGLGRLAPAEVLAAGRADLEAIAALLAERSYLFGDEPCTVDATLTGFLWSYASNPFPSALKDTAAAHPNLVAYLARMRERYWRDARL